MDCIHKTNEESNIFFFIYFNRHHSYVKILLEKIWCGYSHTMPERDPPKTMARLTILILSRVI